MWGIASETLPVASMMIQSPVAPSTALECQACCGQLYSFRPSVFPNRRDRDGLGGAHLVLRTAHHTMARASRHGTHHKSWLMLVAQACRPLPPHS
jgi:hypothetical protein